MPPTPGIFPVPYNTNQTHNPPGAVISSSVNAPTTTSTVAGPGGSQVVIGPGVPGAPPPPPGFGPPQHHPPAGKMTRVPGVSGVLNGGPTDGGEMYGPGIGHGLQAHGHGHGHGSHSLHHAHAHHYSLGGSSSRHGRFYFDMTVGVEIITDLFSIFLFLSVSHLWSNGRKSQSERKAEKGPFETQRRGRSSRRVSLYRLFFSNLSNQQSSSVHLGT